MHHDFAMLREIDRPPEWAGSALSRHVRDGAKLLRACHGVTCWWNVVRRSLLVGWPRPGGDGIAALCEIPVVHPDRVTPDFWSFDALNRDLYLRNVPAKVRQRQYAQQQVSNERERKKALALRSSDSAMLAQAEDRVRFGVHKAEQGKHSKRKVLVQGLKE